EHQGHRPRRARRPPACELRARAAVAAAGVLAELIGLTDDVILVDRMALAVHMLEGVVGDRTEVDHHRCLILHENSPSSIKRQRSQGNYTLARIGVNPFGDGLSPPSPLTSSVSATPSEQRGARTDLLGPLYTADRITKLRSN